MLLRTDSISSSFLFVTGLNLIFSLFTLLWYWTRLTQPLVNHRDVFLFLWAEQYRVSVVFQRTLLLRKVLWSLLRLISVFVDMLGCVLLSFRFLWRNKWIVSNQWETTRNVVIHYPLVFLKDKNLLKVKTSLPTDMSGMEERKELECK